MNLFKCILKTEIKNVNINQGDIWQMRVEDGKIMIKDVLMAFPVKEVEIDSCTLIKNFIPVNLVA